MSDAAGPSLERITERLRREAGRADGFGKSVKLDFGPDGVVLIDARQSPPAVSNENAPADTVLHASIENFARLARGELEPVGAMLTGKLRVTGDMGAAMKLAQLLRSRT